MLTSRMSFFYGWENDLVINRWLLQVWKYQRFRWEGFVCFIWSVRWEGFVIKLKAKMSAFLLLKASNCALEIWNPSGSSRRLSSQKGRTSLLWGPLTITDKNTRTDILELSGFSICKGFLLDFPLKNLSCNGVCSNW